MLKVIIMHHIRFPFAESIDLSIVKAGKTTIINCELASSDVEIFQSLNYRKKSIFKRPLVLKFASPTLETYSSQNFDFAVEQICVDHVTNVVKKISVISPHKRTGTILQGYTEFSIVILAPVGFAREYRVKEDNTIINYELIEG